MLVGVPLFAWIYSTVKRLAESSLSKKGLDTKTEAYDVKHLLTDDDLVEAKILKKVEEAKEDIQEKITGEKESGENPDEAKRD